MIPIYKESGELILSLNRNEMPKGSLGQLQKNMVQSCIVEFEGALLIGHTHRSIEEGEVDPKDIKLVVMLQKAGTQVDCNPIPIYIRKTDRKGIKITLTPYTSIEELRNIIAEKMGLPIISQELYHNGDRIDDGNETLKSIGLKPNKIIHVIDKKLIYVDLETPFTIFIQGAQHKSPVMPLEVKGGLTLRQLKMRAAEKMAMNPDNTIIAYCSQILEEPEATLFGLSITDGANLKVLDENQAVIQYFNSKEEEDTFIKRKKMALAHLPEEDQRQPQMHARQANSMVWQQNKDISILNSEMIERSFAQSYRINESYEQTYNRALKAVQKPNDLIYSPFRIPEKQSGSMGQIQSANMTQYSIVVDNPGFDRANQFFLVVNSGINTYKILVSEIDTVKDLRNKLETCYPEIKMDGHELIFQGRAVSDEQTIRELDLQANSELTLV